MLVSQKKKLLSQYTYLEFINSFACYFKNREVSRAAPARKATSVTRFTAATATTSARVVRMIAPTTPHVSTPDPVSTAARL